TLVRNQSNIAGLSPLFACPGTQKSASSAQSLAGLANEIDAGRDVAYIYLGRGVVAQTVSADVVLMYEPAGNHKLGINVLYGDTSVQSINSHQEARFIEELTSGHNPPRAEKIR